MKKIMVIFGTRPEAIKLAPVIKEIEKNCNNLTNFVCVTAQHRDMLDQVLKIFEIVPDCDLNLMNPNQQLIDFSSKAIKNIGHLIKKENPDFVLVQGDTTTAFVASLAAFYHKIPIGHIEAGLRTNDKFNPFPEEINRRLISAVADLHFTPTQSSRENLLRENIPDSQIYVTGNSVIDALFWILKKNIELTAPCFEKIDFNKRIILVTVHRRESFGQYIEEICQGLVKLVKMRDGIEIVYPVHPNPNILQPVKKLVGEIPNIHLIPPLDYAVFISLMNKSHIILSDSGGIQEEAPSLGKPVLVLREVTERPEAVAAGTVKIIGRTSEKIVHEVCCLIDDQKEYNKMARAMNPYGDGRASQRIIQHIIDFNDSLGV